MLNNRRTRCTRNHTTVRRRLARILPLLLVAMLLIPTPAAAYTDPGSGSLFLQMLLAAGVGSLFYVHRLVRWLRRLFGGGK